MAAMIQIDGQKLKHIIEERKLKKSHVSKELGFNSCFINKCIYKNEMSQAAARMLEVLFGIQFDDYKYVEPEPVPEPTTEPEPVVEPVAEQAEEDAHGSAQVVPLDMEQLQKAVALALDNMRTDYDALRSAIREGILDALVQAVNNNDTRNAIIGILSNAHLSALQLNLRRVREEHRK